MQVEVRRELRASELLIVLLQPERQRKSGAPGNVVLLGCL